MSKIILIPFFIFLLHQCNQLGLSKDSNNNTATIAALALANNSKSSSTSTSCTSSTSTGSTITTTSATIDSSSDCINGVTSCMDSALPSWIKDNFKCSVAYVSGSSYVFKSKNLPNTKSYYYTSYSGTTPSTTAPLYEALPSGNTKAGSNVIASQSMVYTIPATTSTGSGTVSTQGGLVAIGITTNGLAIFNNAAAPPDTLSVEAGTFDNYQGHPQSSGVYHHHAGVPKVCDNTLSTSNSGACNNSKLIGIALDGYPIYAQKCNTGSGSDFTPTLDTYHGHTGTTKEFSTATYHYHYAYDSTATIYTLMGSYFRGNIGSVSN